MTSVRVEASRERLDRRQRDVRDHDSAGGSRSSSRRRRRASTSTPFARAFSRVASIDGVLDVDADHGREAEQRGGDREHTRSAADVEQRAGLELLQELEAELGRRMGAGAEGAAGVDDDRERIVRAASPTAGRPRGARSAPAGGRRASGPPTRPRHRSLRAPPKKCHRRSSPRRVGVGGELDALRAVDLLEALAGRARASSRAPPRARSRPTSTADAAQACSAERALQLLEEALVVRGRCRSSLAASKSSSSRRCSSVRRRGHGDVDEHAVVAAAEALAAPACPCRAARAPRRAARRRRTRARVRPSSVSTVTVAPSAAWTIVRSTCE